MEGGLGPEHQAMKDAPLVVPDPSGKIADRLTVILGLLGLLRDGAFGGLTDRQRQAVREVYDTSEELRELLGPVIFH